ncbi:hypothetical protein LOCC1_G001345 [Lachnellula occidentalis]|uniref:Nuclear pore protein n=1 Tax=Lachnellula occidentalis TaxID=215460 RepID=A0A8H8UI09_9HELO|nr:hypothetical protein LOCC1_G001345 [Lachnellula occidentalis]
MRVTYGKKQIVGKVCSSSMVLASPVWKKFIFPPFLKLWDTESTRADKEKMYLDPKRVAEELAFLSVFPDGLPIGEELESDDMVDELDFSDDNGNALLLLLQIAHLQFRRVPDKVDFQLLHQVAVLCDLYDCVTLIEPWVESWITKAHELPMPLGSGVQDQWIFIAWVFGKEEIFGNCATTLTRVVTVDLQGGCFYENRPLDPYMPAGLLESIKRIRLSDIKCLLDIPYGQAKRIASVYNQLPPTKRYTKCTKGLKQCDAMVYGSLTLALQSLDLWPQRSPESITVATENLADLLLSKMGKIHHMEDHASCITTDTSSRVAAIMGQLRRPTLPAHREHMRIQREKLTYLAIE